MLLYAATFPYRPHCMFRPLELFIGLRYARAKRRSQFISFISVVSIVCITISVMALITVMSVMNGFDYQLRSRILGAVSHVTISAYPGEALPAWQQDLAEVRKLPHVVGAAPYLELQSFLAGRGSTGAQIRGVDPGTEPQVSTFNAHMVTGQFQSLQPGSWHILLGSDLATKLGLAVGDKVLVVIPRMHSSPLTGSLPVTRSFTVSGIYALGMEEYDANMALIDIHDAEALQGIHGPGGIRVQLDDMNRAAQVARQLQNGLGPQVFVSTWMDDNSNFFSALAMEKKVMFIILSLIVLVAVINLVSMLMMLVTDKQAEIAILRTLGSTPRSIMGTFMVQGVLVGVVGIALGVSLGCLLSWQVPAIVKLIERIFHVTFLSPDVYYISEVPSRLDPVDVLAVAVVTFLFALLATIYPAWRASRTQPAQALRYE